MTYDVEPLDSALWFRQVRKIASGQLAGIEQSLRHALHLLQLTPLRFRHAMRLAIDEDDFEALLEAGDLDSAARHLIAQPTALRVEEHEGGLEVRATISCSVQHRAFYGTGTSAAAAVLSAWASRLLSLELDESADRVRVRDRAPRGEPCEQDPRSGQH